VLFTGPVWLSLLIPILVALVLLGASLAARQWRRPGDRALLLSASGLALAFVTGGAPFAAALAVLVVVTHAIALRVEHAAAARTPGVTTVPWPARVWALIGVSVQIAAVAAIARAGVLRGPLQGIGGALVPFGISYFAFHGIGYIVDVYRGHATAERSRFQLALHLLLLPQIVAGPVAYEGLARQFARRLPGVSDFSYGVRRLVIGMWKVFVMARFAGAEADVVFALPPARLNAFQAWLGLATLTLQMYYGFSGYSDMGIGVGRMLGIRLPENFRWPYVAGTVREFWQRWHMGLSTWFRQYADVSFDAGHIPPPSVRREALVVFLCGLWYGVGWTFVVWGLYHASLVAAERVGGEALLKRLPAPLRHLYLVAVVMVGWVILRSETPGGALQYLVAAAGLNASALRARPVVGVELWLLLIAGAIGCAPLLPSIRRWTVAVDALIVSLLMMMFASLLFAWRCGRLIVSPLVRLSRGSAIRDGRGQGRALP